ncbi:response regulator [Azonexus sp.]|uniref:response regulator n=1 Tax=Azonexus sp. TaxID=1872668 RepID=UPI0039E2E1F4
MQTYSPKSTEMLENEEMLLVLQQALTKKRVLIVDRHAPARESVRLMLGTLGVTQVHGAGNAAEVIRQVRANRFDIILSDFVLDDGRDGQQLLEELRHAALIGPGTVYIIVTGERTYTNVVALAELAPDDYLIKPFTADQLQARLIRAIYKKHLLRRIYEKIEASDFDEALAACDRVITQHPAYMYDAYRFKGELLLQLGRTEEAEALFRKVLEGRMAPWVNMGLATALRDRGALEEAALLAEQVLIDAPDFLAAYDFLAAVQEKRGLLENAQEVLQRAADVSPHNTLRQRMVGDIAARNEDLLSAEKAYGKVLERSKGSSLRSVDDFANLARTMAERGNIDASRKLLGELKRELRGDKEAELAALSHESLCLAAEGASDKARACAEQAIALQKTLEEDLASRGKTTSQRLNLDLAQACYASGLEAAGEQIIRQTVAENHDDNQLIHQASRVFEKTNQAQGASILEQINRQINELSSRGENAARAGDLAGAADLYTQAAEQAPNIRNLIEAANSLYLLMDRRGWDASLAASAHDYLERAQRKDRKHPKVLATRQLAHSVARKYGIDVTA